MANEYNLPDPVAKLIGIFLGKDIALLPNDTFTKVFDLGEKHLEFRDLQYPHRSSVRASEGLSIKNYRVVRLTACFAHLLLLSEYRFYRVITWGNPVVSTDYWFCIEDQDYKCRYGITFCKNDMIFPESTKGMADADKIRDFRDIMFDGEIDELVIRLL